MGSFFYKNIKISIETTKLVSALEYLTAKSKLQLNVAIPIHSNCYLKHHFTFVFHFFPNF